MSRSTIRSMAIQPRLNLSAESMDPQLDCVTTSHATQPSNCSMTAKAYAGKRPPTAEAGNLTLPSEEKPVMKRAQLLLLAAAILVAGSALLLRRAAAAGGEVDVIVNKANTVDDLPISDAQKDFMGDKTTWPRRKR